MMNQRKGFVRGIIIIITFLTLCLLVYSFAMPTAVPFMEDAAGIEGVNPLTKFLLLALPTFILLGTIIMVVSGNNG